MSKKNYPPGIILRSLAGPSCLLPKSRVRWFQKKSPRLGRKTCVLVYSVLFLMVYYISRKSKHSLLGYFVLILGNRVGHVIYLIVFIVDLPQDDQPFLTIERTQISKISAGLFNTPAHFEPCVSTLEFLHFISQGICSFLNPYF